MICLKAFKVLNLDEVQIGIVRVTYELKTDSCEDKNIATLIFKVQ